MPRMLAVLATALAVTIVAAGCGGGDDSATSGSATDGGTTSSGTGAPLSTADFLKKGSAVCAKGIEEIEKNFEAFSKEKNLGKGKEPGKAEVEEAIETILIPGVSKQADGIAALSAPRGEEEAVEDFLKRLEAELEAAEKDPTVLTKGASFQKSREEAQAIGLNGCPAG